MRRLLVICTFLGFFCAPSSALAWTGFMNVFDKVNLLTTGLKNIMSQPSPCANLFLNGIKIFDENPAEAAVMFQRFEAEGCADKDSAKEYTPRVNLLLGVQNLLALGVPLDIPQGVRRLTQAVKEESLPIRLRAHAAGMLGMLYYDDELGVKDPKKAERWLKRAIKMGSSKAEFALGFLYDDEESPLYNWKKAEKYLLAAAEAGEIDAQTYLGIFYYFSDTPHSDMDKAVKWLTTAGNSNAAEARFMLGSIYGDETLPKYFDPKRAVRWYTMAAAKDYAQARVALGWMQLEGLGTVKDLQQAEKQFTAAAMTGNVEGAMALTTLYAINLEENVDAPQATQAGYAAQALKWMLLAEKLDDQIAETLAESGDEPMSITDTRKEWEKYKEEYTKMLTPAMLEQVSKEAAELHETITRKTQTD